ncbi:MAG: SAM-dependent methyltransferase [Steroidobacteraceae bacterium]
MTIGASTTTLPPPSAAAAAHSASLRERLVSRIGASGGWLAFDDYMDAVLYSPGLGYYSAGATKFGAAGDFVTAPKISPLFARSLARQFADVLAVTGGGILEVGAGSGRFARDALAELARLQVLPDRYAILDVSADLRARQREEIGRAGEALAARVAWLDGFPQHQVGVVFANELLDALPCDRFVIRGGRPQRLGVTVRDGGFAWYAACGAMADRGCLLAGRGRAHTLLGDRLAQLPDGYSGEIAPRIEGWLQGVAARLERGVVILVDYGLPRSQYYHPQRLDGTLRCHVRQHAHHDPFLYPGLCDITSWVDFTRVAEAAVAAGLEVAGFTTQAAWLLALGVESLAAETLPDGADRDARVPAAHLAAMHGLKRLLLPGEMGEAVKVMVLTRGWDAPLRGLRLRDLRDSL